MAQVTRRNKARRRAVRPADGEAQQLATINRAALAIAGDLDLDTVLRRILTTARSLVKARYGALGVPDGAGGFDKFITVGFSDALARRIGELPRFHGVLGDLVRDGKSIRMADIRRHPHFSWYPEHHPILKEFLGVPIKHRAEILGEIFFSGTKTGRFSARDQRLVEMLAAHAGIAIATARLYARAQELAIMEERNRLARELHDAASQTLFSMMYEARAARLSASQTGDGAPAAFRRLEEQASAALGEMRGLVFALRPKSLERDGFVVTLQDHIDGLRRAHGADIVFRVEGKPELALDVETAVFRIAQEALQNSLKHAGGAQIEVLLRHDRLGTELIIKDKGRGFDPARLPATQRTMGMSTMQERAATINARLSIDSAPGQGSTIHLSLDKDTRA
jgi:signal transduction histidine kinase